MNRGIDLVAPGHAASLFLAFTFTVRKAVMEMMRKRRGLGILAMGAGTAACTAAFDQGTEVCERACAA